MKKLIKLSLVVLSVFALTSTAHSYEQDNQEANDKMIFLSHCSNYGQGVSFAFQSCVNRNFDAIKRELNNSFYMYCSNIGSDVSFSYTSCIRNNFNTVERDLQNGVYLQYCSNFGRELDYFYISCVNSNFRSIERYINRQ
ncbi:MAG: hypothetical protein GY909_07635 [Oligoflexia bacterium]|nr:hypothetical protein [Oligoflexia bacterium]